MSHKPTTVFPVVTIVNAANETPKAGERVLLISFLVEYFKYVLCSIDYQPERLTDLTKYNAFHGTDILLNWGVG